MSPGSSRGASFSSIWSTGLPAIIIIRMRRGFASDCTNSFKSPLPVILRSLCSCRNFVTHSASRFQTATRCPWSSTFSARFCPITPRPMTPNCAEPTAAEVVLIFRTPYAGRPTRPAGSNCKDGLLARSSHRRAFKLLHCCQNFLQPTNNVVSKVHANRTPVPLRQRLEIPQRLRLLQHAKCELLARQRHILRIIRNELHKHAAVRTALVQLSRGMQEPRPVSGRRRHARFIAHRRPDLLDHR